jgi:hypothetical protein
MKTSVSYDYIISRFGENGCGFTPIGGLYVTLINNTGNVSVKGTVVSASSSGKGAVSFATLTTYPIGVICEDGKANGESVKVVIAGIAEILLEEGKAAESGYWCCVSTDTGRINQYAIKSEISEELSRQVGYSLETKANEINQTSLVMLKF